MKYFLHKYNSDGKALKLLIPSARFAIICAKLGRQKEFLKPQGGPGEARLGFPRTY